MHCRTPALVNIVLKTSTKIEVQNLTVIPLPTSTVSLWCYRQKEWATTTRSSC